MKAPPIQTKGLTKNYDKKAAVKDVDLEIKQGEVFGFLGPNGAGKTTTMKMLVGLIPQTSGSIRIFGHPPSLEKPAFKVKIGYLPESVHLYEKLSGVEHLEFVGRLYRVPQKKRHERIKDLTQLFNLEDCANRFVETYSKGQKQKLALAMTLIHDPDLLLLDEPTSGLDPKASKMIREIIISLREEKKTIFLSTHLLDVVEKVCTRAGIIYEGKLVAVDSVKNLAKRNGSLEDTFIGLTGGMDKGDIKKWRKRTRSR
jgi:ABC-2 type transport system ATP-binding protein